MSLPQTRQGPTFTSLCARADFADPVWHFVYQIALCFEGG